MGISTPATCKHLGLQLGESIEATILATMENIEPKRIKRRIMATTPPTDLLHRSVLINTALIPIYNHIFMALPLRNEDTDNLQQEILDFLWTRQRDGETIQKRRLVAKGRIPASHHKGGLQVPHPKQTIQGLHLNLLQKIYNRIREPNRFPASLLPQILQETLNDANCPSLSEHLEYLGPERWEKTAARLERRNLLFSQAFQAMATLLRMHENQRSTWHVASINGHSKFNKLLPLTRAEENRLREAEIVTISQIYEIDDLGQLHNAPNPELEHQLRWEPALREKLTLLRQSLQRLRLPFRDKKHEPQASGGLLLRGERNISQHYRRETMAAIDKKIGIAPAYNTRRTDGVYYPSPQTFEKAFETVDCPFLPSKTKEVVFQILNRTIWTNNKAFKSGKQDLPDCTRCGQPELGTDNQNFHRQPTPTISKQHRQPTHDKSATKHYQRQQQPTINNQHPTADTRQLATNNNQRQQQQTINNLHPTADIRQ